MTSNAGSPELLPPIVVWRRSLPDPVRTLQICLLVVVLGYGARQDNNSPFIIPILENVIGSTFTGIEIVLLLIALLELVRRLAWRDPYLNRTPVRWPLWGVTILLAVTPYLRMLFYENGFRFPLELTGFPVFVATLFLYSQIFRRNEVAIMAWLIFLAGLYKSIEGVVIYQTVGLGWGLLTGWRDAALLTMMVVGAMIAWIVRPESDRVYRTLRRALFLAIPIALFTFTNSTRRSYILGAIVSLVIILFYLHAREKRRLLKVVPVVVATVLAAAFMTGTNQFLERMSVLSNPSSEGSSAYRLVEVFNITQEISERPLFGWPFGQIWRNFTVIEFENVSNVMPHNTYLYVAWRSGLVGLSVWLWFLVVLLRAHHRTVRQARRPLERFLALWGMSCTVSVIIAGFTMSAVADRLQTFFPFVIAMSILLPGALSLPGRSNASAGSGMIATGASETP